MQAEKIMIVDDNKEFLNELKELLSLTGYDTIGVTDSKKAVDIAHKTKPNLILLDLKMKGANGFELARALKGMPATVDIPIVAMSGYFPIEKESLLLDRSFMRAYLKKPFCITDLIVQIESILNPSTHEINLMG